MKKAWAWLVIVAFMVTVGCECYRYNRKTAEAGNRYSSTFTFENGSEGDINAENAKCVLWDGDFDTLKIGDAVRLYVGIRMPCAYSDIVWQRDCGTGFEAVGKGDFYAFSVDETNIGAIYRFYLE